jgi:hypothetical protein
VGGYPDPGIPETDEQAEAGISFREKTGPFLVIFRRKLSLPDFFRYVLSGARVFCRSTGSGYFISPENLQTVYSGIFQNNSDFSRSFLKTGCRKCNKYSSIRKILPQ